MAGREDSARAGPQGFVWREILRLPCVAACGVLDKGGAGVASCGGSAAGGPSMPLLMPALAAFPVGLGAMRLTEPEVADPAALVAAAVAGGVRLIDTASCYGPTPSKKGPPSNEGLVAAALAGLAPEVRRGVLVATKVGLVKSGARFAPDGDPKALTKVAERSLKILGTPNIDLLQLHVRDPRVPVEDSLAALADLHARGLVRAIGLCNTTPGGLATALAVLPPGALVSVQQPLCPLTPADVAAAAALLPLCRALGLVFLAHSPLGGPEKARAPRATATLVKALGLPADAGIAARATLLAWLGTLGPDVVPLPGPTRHATLSATLSAAGEMLSRETISALDAAFPAVAALRELRPPVHAPDLVTARTLALAPPGPRPDPAAEGVVLTVGIQGAGKSSAIAPWLARGALRLNRDTEGGRLDDLLAPLARHLAEAAPGTRRAILDNTYATARARAPVIAAAHAAGVPVHALWLDTPLHEARVNVVRRMISLTGRLCGPDELKALGEQHANLIPPAAHQTFLGLFEPPTRLEGFDSVSQVPFVRAHPPRAEPRQRALLLDVDGTLRVSRAGEKYPRAPDDVVVLPGRAEVLARWHAAGWRLFFVSNQSGVASGQLGAEDVAATMDRTAALLGVPITEVAVCPHPAFPVGCFCRKPMPGLGVWLLDRHGLHPEDVLMVGDLASDAGFAAGLGVRFVSAEAFFGAEGPTPETA
jgi:HAD superfamily hydrolase (TIGR01662 family)